MEHKHKVLVYVFGALKDLEDYGAIESQAGFGILPKGIAEYDQIKATGFKPTSEEIDQVFKVMVLRGHLVNSEKELEKLGLLVRRLDDVKEYIEQRSTK